MHLESLIGRAPTDAELQEFLSGMDEEPEMDSFAGMELRLFPRNGLDLYFDEQGRLVTLFLYGPGHDDHRGYAGRLPGGLCFSDSARDLALKMGPATLSGTEEGTNLPYERFDSEPYCVHLQYGPEKGDIRLITIMALPLEL